jgi:hypothetical protein
MIGTLANAVRAKNLAGVNCMDFVVNSAKSEKSRGPPTLPGKSPHLRCPAAISIHDDGMKVWSASTVALCGLLLIGCKQNASSKAITGPPQVGGLYSVKDGEGGFRIAKVLAVDQVVFVQLFTERWTTRPESSTAPKATQPVGVAYSFETVQGMQPVLLGETRVTSEELESYEEWKQSRQEVF